MQTQVPRTRLRWLLSAVAAAMLLTACGGGDDDDDSNQPPAATPVKRVQVIGDSLADSGVVQGVPTYGRTFTIQGSSSEPYTIWPERIAQYYGQAPLCPVYRFDGRTFSLNTTAGCTSFAVGGARINNSLQGGGQASPQALLRQMQDLRAKGLATGDLVLIDGGGNDAADLAAAFISSPINLASEMRTLVKTLLSDQEIEAALKANGLSGVGELYMERLADTLFDQIQGEVLAGNDVRVMVLNVPNVSQTPRFVSALDQIEALLGARLRESIEEDVSDWVDAFNAQLARRATAQSRVAVADFEERLDALIEQPARFGLTNVTKPACEPGFNDGAGKPVNLDFEHCTAQALSALTPPVGVTGGANWWQTYLFADGFHPTPYGHQLMADLVKDNLRRVGWAP